MPLTVQDLQSDPAWKTMTQQEQDSAIADMHRLNAQIYGLHPAADMPQRPTVPEARLPGSIQPAMGMPPVRVPMTSTMPDRPIGQRERSGILPMVGGAIGQGIALGAAPATAGASLAALPLLDATLSTAGYTLESVLAQGRFPSWKELAAEFGMSALPGVVESAGKYALKRGTAAALRQGVAGKVLRQSEQYRRGVAAATGVFNAPTYETVKGLFDQVRATGKKLDTDELLTALQTKYTAAQRQTLLAEMGKVDAEINRRLGRQGDQRFREMYSEILEALRPAKPQPPSVSRVLDATGQPVILPTPAAPIKTSPQIDIGDAQDLRSALRVLSESYDARKIATPAADAVHQLKTDVDDMILSRLQAAPDDPNSALLQQARREYHRYAAAEDLTSFLTMHSRVLTGKAGPIRQLNLNAVVDDLEKNASPLAKSLNKNLNALPEAKAAWARLLDDLAPLNRYIEVTNLGGEGVRNIPFVSTMMRGIGESMLSHEGARELAQSTLQHAGQLDTNKIAQAVNVVRRKKVSTEEQGQKLPGPDTFPPEILQAIRTLMQGNVRPAE